MQGDEANRRYRDWLAVEAPKTGTPLAGAAQTLLLLNAARDNSPITHGSGSDADLAVRQAVAKMTATWGPGSSSLTEKVTGVDTLLEAAIDAAEIWPGAPRTPADVATLITLHAGLRADVEATAS